jgi:hypothetical protein
MMSLIVPERAWDPDVAAWLPLMTGNNHAAAQLCMKYAMRALDNNEPSAVDVFMYPGFTTCMHAYITSHPRMHYCCAA